MKRVPNGLKKASSIEIKHARDKNFLMPYMITKFRLQAIICSTITKKNQKWHWHQWWNQHSTIFTQNCEFIILSYVNLMRNEMKILFLPYLRMNIFTTKERDLLTSFVESRPKFDQAPFSGEELQLLNSQNFANNVWLAITCWFKFCL